MSPTPVLLNFLTVVRLFIAIACRRLILNETMVFLMRGRLDACAGQRSFFTIRCAIMLFNLL